MISWIPAFAGMTVLVSDRHLKSEQLPIANALELKHKKHYQDTLIARVRSDAELAGKLRQRVGLLTDALDGSANSERV